jgi:hypothetical protein
VKKGVVQQWLRLTTEDEFETRAIAIVHLNGHEMFHFLWRTKQVPGANRENGAGEFALSLRRGRVPEWKEPGLNSCRISLHSFYWVG